MLERVHDRFECEHLVDYRSKFAQFNATIHGLETSTGPHSDTLDLNYRANELSKLNRCFITGDKSDHVDATQTTEIVQFLLNFAPRSQPLGLRSFAALGIDAQQVSELVQQGWLRRLSEDAYLLRGDQPSVDGTIAYLRAFIPNLHVGGRTALEWHRMTHHLRFRERTDLWGRGYCSIPSWAVDRLSCSYYSHSLFDTGMDEGHMAETFAGTKTLEP